MFYIWFYDLLDVSIESYEELEKRGLTEFEEYVYFKIKGWMVFVEDYWKYDCFLRYNGEI